MATATTASQWTVEDVSTLYHQPLLQLIEQAHALHQLHQPRRTVQLCHLLSIKTGGCPEDCSYCPQSARYHTAVEAGKLMDTAAVLHAAGQAKTGGASRFCMGAAWRQVKEGPDFDRVLDMVRGVAALDMEVCCTLGMLTAPQAQRLAQAGLTAYNHNLDTSPEFYGHIITTRTFEDRLRTLEHVREAGISVCCGGILGLGEDEADRVRLLFTLAGMNPPPESVPINALVAVEGTPLAHNQPVDAFEMVRAIATARILMPHSRVRLSAGRLSLSDEAQALCFYAGANSIFTGEKLLTTPNSGEDHDHALLQKLGLDPEPAGHSALPARAHAPAALDAHWAAELDQRESQARRRRLGEAQGEDFCSNDYLGLSRHPGIRAALVEALDHGLELGATGSRLVRGNHPAIAELEADFAAWQNREAALLYSSGYSASLGVLSALLRPGDIVFSDQRNHASLIEGMRASGARRVLVPHLDLDALEQRLCRYPALGAQRRWVVVESLFSMDGDFAPLTEIAALCHRHGAALIVDEAHATGLYGPEGAGRVAAAGQVVQAAAAAVLHPCGKALGAAGCLVTGSRRLIEYLINTSRSFIYSTAPSPLLAVQLRAALDVVRRQPLRRRQLLALARQLRTDLAAAGVPALGADSSPILPVLAGSDQAALALQAALAEEGLDVRAIRPPTVPEGSARLRITVHADQNPAACRLLARVLAAHL
ncbi:MAG: biotin synthase BioB [Terriglobales bacterium]